MRMCKKLCDCGVKFGSFSINRVWILCTVIIQTLLVSLILSVCRYGICLFIKGIIRCKKKYKVIYILDLYNNEVVNRAILSVVNRAILSVTPWSHHCPTFFKTIPSRNWIPTRQNLSTFTRIKNPYGSTSWKNTVEDLQKSCEAIPSKPVIQKLQINILGSRRYSAHCAQSYV